MNVFSLYSYRSEVSFPSSFWREEFFSYLQFEMKIGSSFLYHGISYATSLRHPPGMANTDESFYYHLQS